ncbi:hypothetical protein SBOR_10119 [Sclerotinia borealis F-4128]|uniref:Uncharacterized protein n=1 Tax=Sclerotinia borealis (strain F-4128) TaxID=1432307 RepID=W9C0Q4_SCLBF|nr:hypothetical protein SBOR_10119 [Sclerotinia borealis F-4128]
MSSRDLRSGKQETYCYAEEEGGEYYDICERGSGVARTNLFVEKKWKGGKEKGTKEFRSLFLTLKLSDHNGANKGFGFRFEIPATRVEARDFASPWTIVHGFYAGMGGFVFDFENSEDNTPPFIPNYQRLTLSARGVSLLAECGYLPDISKREIVDKSKADTMAKLLVILQAGWMLVQVIGRLVSDLPVTLLEVNTLGHVLCTFIIYMLWWHKPRSIMMPTKLKGDWVKPLCAYMYMSSQISGHDSRHPGILKRSWKDSELSRFMHY